VNLPLRLRSGQAIQADAPLAPFLLCWMMRLLSARGGGGLSVAVGVTSASQPHRMSGCNAFMNVLRLISAFVLIAGLQSVSFAQATSSSHSKPAVVAELFTSEGCSSCPPADALLAKMRYVPGAADLRIQQPFDEPYLHLRVERTKAEELGFTAHDIAQNLLVSLSGSFQTSPTFWVDPKTHVSYQIATQTPEYRTNTLQDLENVPVTGTNPAAPPSIMASLVSTQRGTGMATVSHYNVAPVVDIYGSVSGRDLGGVSRDINKIIDGMRHELPRGSHVVVRGQVQTMRSSYIGLLSGLAFSIVLVYLLIVVNFQSWLDPFIMISALPAALAGIAWFLFVTHTNLSVPALMGAIMCMGVATSNSILVVSFATEQMGDGKNAVEAALDAGFTRFRPVLMTALAMIIGMVPMALGLGDGGEQNAPLGRAVIGGLLFATVSTLLFVPAFFSVLQGRLATHNESVSKD